MTSRMPNSTASKKTIRTMGRIDRGFILPSAAFTVRPGQVKFYRYVDRPPLLGDVVYGMIGGLSVLEGFGLEPDAISGICSSSPLHVRELRAFTNVPVFNGVEADKNQLAEILLQPSKHSNLNQIAV